MIKETLFGLLIPFIGTSLGSSMVFFMQNKMTDKIEKFLLGLSSGVMIAASFFSLIVPSIEMAEKQNIVAWIPPSIGIGVGFILFIIIEIIIKNLNKDIKGNIPKKKNKIFLMILAITLHNIPEGMAVGVIFSGVMLKDPTISLLSAFSLSLGIAIQNIPEGAIISLPLKANGKTKFKSFLLGSLSGIVEPIGGLITLILANTMIKILPYLLSFAAGAMLFVVIDEIIPEAKNGDSSFISTIASAIGFILMMILDIALG